MKDRVFDLQLPGNSHPQTSQQAEELVADILENMADATIAADSDEKFVYVNRQAERLFGKKREELLGNKIWETLSAIFEFSTYQELQKALASKAVLEFEEFLPSLNGWFAVRFYPSAKGIECYFRDIGAHKQAEQKLRESEARYRRIVETAREGLWTIDERGKTEFVNPRMAAMLGYTVEEMFGRSFFDFMDETARKEAEHYFSRRIEGIKEVHDFRFRHKDGSDIWTIVSTNPILDDKGGFFGALATITDITERKQAEVLLQKAYDELEILVCNRTAELTQTNQLLRKEIAERQQIETELQKEREFLKVVLECARAGIVACDDKGILTLFNQAAREFHGLLEEKLPPEEWANKYDLYLPDGKTLMKKEDIPLFRALQAEAIDNLEMTIVPKKGMVRTLIASGQAVFDANGKKQGAVVVMHDITERKQAELALRANEQKLTRIFQTIPDGIIILNSEGQIIETNVAAEKILGLTESNLIERVYNDLAWQITTVDGKPFPEEELPFARVMQTQEAVYNVEHAISYPDGTRKILSINAAPICNSQGEIVTAIATLTDITERKRMESALQQSEQQFRTTFEQAPIGIALVELDGRAREINPALQQMLGYDRAELLQLGLVNITDPEDADVDSKLFRKISAGECDRARVEKRYFRKDGELVWARLNVALVRNANGVGEFCIAMVEDITQAKQVGEALQESEERYRSVIQAAAEGIVLQHADGTISACNASAEAILGLGAENIEGKSSLDPEWNAIHEDGSPFPGDSHPSMMTLQTGQPQSNVVMGLPKRDGTISWISINTRPLFRPQETSPHAVVASFFDITERKEAESQKVQLIQEQTARIEAEASRQRFAFLAEVSSILSSSLDYETTLKSIARLAVPELADWCAIDLIDDFQELQRVEVTHIDPEKVDLAWELYRRYPPEQNSANGLMKVLRTGKSDWAAEITEEILLAGAIDKEHLQILRQLCLKSYMVVPLSGHKGILGAITFVSAESNRHYQPEDLALAEEIGYRAGIAIDNSRLYRQAQKLQRAAELAANRTARLQAVTAGLSQSLTAVEVAEVIVEQGVSALDASSALIALLDERGELEILRTYGYKAESIQQWRRFSINAPFPLAEAVRTGEPIWEESTQMRVARYPHLKELYDRQQYAAWISLPLIVEGRSIGGMSLSFKEPQQLKDEDRAFILALAQQCAQAIYRTRLYEAEQSARKEAEAANRVKDEFLAVISHELRTPLNAILGWAQISRQQDLSKEIVAKAFETIERNARAQHQLIEDLLDVSRIVRGQIHLNIKSVDLSSAIDAAIETIYLAAEVKNIQVEVQFDSAPIFVSGDSERLQQVIWNLLSNAVKFTPRGGQIWVRVASRDSHAQIRVIDTGIGIDPEFLPHVFERFRQADSSITRSYGGLGLGLAIVRQIVELHGGNVRAQSEGKGKGATFIIELPLAVQKEVIQKISKPQYDSSASIEGYRALVVDDELDNREFVAFLLQQYEMEVKTAASTEEALEILELWQPDVLISDLGMPEEDGYVLINKVRTSASERIARIPAIALSAYPREEDRNRSLKAGFEVHLSKPTDTDKLIEAIAKAIGSRV